MGSQNWRANPPLGLRELCSKNSSLFYSEFSQKSLHYACYYSFYAPHCCHYSIFCIPMIINYKVYKLLKQIKGNVVAMHVQLYIIILQHQ